MVTGTYGGESFVLSLSNVDILVKMKDRIVAFEIHEIVAETFRIIEKKCEVLPRFIHGHQYMLREDYLDNLLTGIVKKGTILTFDELIKGRESLRFIVRGEGTLALDPKDASRLLKEVQIEKRGGT
jgi:hypothetical protein